MNSLDPISICPGCNDDTQPHDATAASVDPVEAVIQGLTEQREPNDFVRKPLSHGQRHVHEVRRYRTQPVLDGMIPAAHWRRWVQDNGWKGSRRMKK